MDGGETLRDEGLGAAGSGTSAGRALEVPICEARLLPQCTGVYVLKDLHGCILYVGKARNIRRRIAQHLREGSRTAEDPARMRRERMLMTAARVVAWLPAGSELEALLLEESLIKCHRPAYNRKGNKFTRHAYLELSLDTSTVRITDRPGTPESYGPFPDEFYTRDLAAVLDELFGISPPSGGGLRRMEPRPEAAQRFLMGYDDGLIGSLKEETTRLASDLQFERAAKVRDRIAFCERYLRRQSFVRSFITGSIIVTEEKPGKSEHWLFHRGRLVDHSECGIPDAWRVSAGQAAAESTAHFAGATGATAESAAHLAGATGATAESAAHIAGATGATAAEPCPPEPRWLLSERASVVSAWLRTDAAHKGVRILPEDRS